MIRIKLLPYVFLSITATSAFALTEKEITYFETYGWIIGQQSGIIQLGLSPEELDFIITGLKLASEGKNAPHNPQLIGPDMETYLKGRAEKFKETYQKRLDASREKQLQKDGLVAEKNKIDGAEYIESIAKGNKKVKKTTSGLYYEIIGEGGNIKPVATDKVKVHYEGKLINGEMFDSSIKRGTPATFGLNQVIKGWTEGLQLIGEGGKVKLYIPSDIAYGDAGRPNIPPGSTLIFDIELLEINPGKRTAVTEPLSVQAPDSSKKPKADDKQAKDAKEKPIEEIGKSPKSPKKSMHRR